MTFVGRGAPELDTLLSVEQAAERLGTSVRFVRRLIAERRIAYVKVGRHVRLDPTDVEAFITASRIEVRSSSVAALPHRRRSSRHASLAPRRMVS
jgi:excisionase family DNA binding protein